MKKDVFRITESALRRLIREAFEDTGTDDEETEQEYSLNGLLGYDPVDDFDQIMADLDIHGKNADRETATESRLRNMIRETVEDALDDMPEEGCLPHTPYSEIRNIRPFRQHGLYFMYHGNKVTPPHLYFGAGTRRYREDGEPNGLCYCHYDNALRPVFLPNGKRFAKSEWSNVSCRYKNGMLYDFYRD